MAKKRKVHARNRRAPSEHPVTQSLPETNTQLVRRYWFDILALALSVVLLGADWLTKVKFVPGAIVITIFTVGSGISLLTAIAVAQLRMTVNPRRTYVPRFNETCWVMSVLWISLIVERLAGAPRLYVLSGILGMCAVVPVLLVCGFIALMLLGFIGSSMYDWCIGKLKEREF